MSREKEKEEEKPVGTLKQFSLVQIFIVNSMWDVGADVITIPYRVVDTWWDSGYL